MKEFMLIFRNADMNGGISNSNPSQNQIQEKKWDEWLGSIAAQGKMTGGVRPGTQGRTVKPGNFVTLGPHAEANEILVGYVGIKANSIDEAVEIAKGCPVLLSGGNVEVRDVIPNPK